MTAKRKPPLICRHLVLTGSLVSVFIEKRSDGVELCADELSRLFQFREFEFSSITVTASLGEPLAGGRMFKLLTPKDEYMGGWSWGWTDEVDVDDSIFRADPSKRGMLYDGTEATLIREWGDHVEADTVYPVWMTLHAYEGLFEGEPQLIRPHGRRWRKAA